MLATIPRVPDKNPPQQGKAVRKPQNPAIAARMKQNLVAIGRSQDPEAFSDFFDYFAGRVKSFLIGKGVTEDLGEELTQEIMIIVWRRAESYDPNKAAASTWLFTIARNRYIDYLRGNSRVQIDSDDALLENQATESDLQEAYVSSEEAVTTISRVMKKLPPEQQQVLQLSYFRGQSHSAIAGWLDIPIGTVKSRIRLAMQNIRQQLADTEEFQA
ncbi:MAG: sigma-70 family RNA polymerase sigma factor [Gammaproteobacteria bacterium]|nr:sigma-70 family RNA polymerase sigma factor [Gammaproteobacteria bacterium]